MSKLRWTECDEKLITMNGSIQYRIRKFDSNFYLASAGLQTLQAYKSQLGAMKACQAYEDALNE